jgi:hypothetical protein
MGDEELEGLGDEATPVEWLARLRRTMAEAGDARSARDEELKATSEQETTESSSTEREERLQDALVHRRDMEELRMALAMSEARVRELEGRLETVIAVAKSAERAPKS